MTTERCTPRLPNHVQIDEPAPGGHRGVDDFGAFLPEPASG